MLTLEDMKKHGFEMELAEEGRDQPERGQPDDWFYGAFLP